MAVDLKQVQEQAKKYLDAAKANKNWVIRGAVLVLIIVLVYSWNSAHRANAELTKLLEAEKLRSANLIVEAEQKQRDLDKREKDLLANNEDLRTEREKLWKALGEKPKVVEVVKWQTVPSATDPNAVARPEPSNVSTTDPLPEILLRKGDQMHAEVNEVTYQTKKDNKVVIGNVACFRDTPSKTMLYKNTFSAALSSAWVEPAKILPRWGAGAFAGFARGGWAVGPKVLFPPKDFWGIRGEVDAGLGIGPSGEFIGAVGAGVRW